MQRVVFQLLGAPFLRSCATSFQRIPTSSPTQKKFKTWTVMAFASGAVKQDSLRNQRVGVYMGRFLQLLVTLNLTKP